MSSPLTKTQAIASPASRLSGVSRGVAALIALYVAGQALAATDAPTTVAAVRPAPAQQAPVEFSTEFFLPQARASIDLTRFERGNPILPGQYRVELYLNGRVLGRTDLTVKPGADPDRGRVCMTRALLDQVGLDWNQLDPSALKVFEDPAACPVLEELLPNAQAEFDTGELRLNLTLPQAALRRAPRGYVSPELWDSGVTGGILNYTANAYRNSTAGSTANSAYLGLNAGFNVGDWHFRHQGSKNWQSGSGAPNSAQMPYRNINTYVERELPSIMGRLLLGDGNTQGNLFSSQSFRGVRLASDDRMLPDSQRGYAPVVRGIAETNARVTIRQGSMVIYDTPVTPGPFVIDDLYPTGYGGDLDVTITEGDGRVRTFTVPYAAVPQLLRPDSHKYSVTAGTLRNTWLSFTPKLFEATYQRGLSNMLTGYGGVQASERYTSALGGIAVGTPYGALAFDLTGARAQLPDSSRLSGTSMRASYSKLFEQTSSSVNISAYRFSTHGFMDMGGAMRTIDAVRHGLSSDTIGRPRSRLALMLSQPLGERAGQLYLSGYMQNYWNGQPKDTQLQAGYSNQFKSVGYSVSVARTRDLHGRTDNRFMLSLSMPLGKPTGRMVNLMTNLTHDASGTAVQTMVSGSAGENNQFSYGATASHGPGDAGTSGTLNGQYVGSRASLMAGYGTGRGYNNLSAGVSGSIVAHPEGVTLSPYTSDTVAVVVTAPEAAGARVLGYTGVVVDSSGHAVLPYLTPYRINEVAIDPNGISHDVELKTTSQQIAPRAGAITLLRYATAAGRAVLIDASLPGGQTLPFGADVVDGEGNVVGSAGQAGRIYARLPGDQASLSVRWGQGQGEQCTMHVALPPTKGAADPSTGIERLKLACVSGAASVHGDTGTTK